MSKAKTQNHEYYTHKKPKFKTQMTSLYHLETYVKHSQQVSQCVSLFNEEQSFIILYQQQMAYLT